MKKLLTRFAGLWLGLMMVAAWTNAAVAAPVDDLIAGAKKEIGFGSQIRSYTFHPYQLIKDHRSGLEIGNVQGVMEGDLDPLVKAWAEAKD